MENPDVIVRDFETRQQALRLPSSRLRSYSDVIERAHMALFQSPEVFDAHLHFQQGDCATLAKITPYNWESCQYFTGSEVEVFIHFVKKSLHPDRAIPVSVAPMRSGQRRPAAIQDPPRTAMLKYSEGDEIPEGYHVKWHYQKDAKGYVRTPRLVLAQEESTPRPEPAPERGSLLCTPPPPYSSRSPQQEESLFCTPPPGEDIVATQDDDLHLWPEDAAPSEPTIEPQAAPTLPPAPTVKPPSPPAPTPAESIGDGPSEPTVPKEGKKSFRERAALLWPEDEATSRRPASRISAALPRPSSTTDMPPPAFIPSRADHQDLRSQRPLSPPASTNQRKMKSTGTVSPYFSPSASFPKKPSLGFSPLSKSNEKSALTDERRPSPPINQSPSKKRKVQKLSPAAQPKQEKKDTKSPSVARKLDFTSPDDRAPAPPSPRYHGFTPSPHSSDDEYESDWLSSDGESEGYAVSKGGEEDAMDLLDDVYPDNPIIARNKVMSDKADSDTGAQPDDEARPVTEANADAEASSKDEVKPDKEIKPDDHLQQDVGIKQEDDSNPTKEPNPAQRTEIIIIDSSDEDEPPASAHHNSSPRPKPRSEDAGTFVSSRSRASGGTGELAETENVRREIEKKKEMVQKMKDARDKKIAGGSAAPEDGLEGDFLQSEGDE